MTRQEFDRFWAWLFATRLRKFATIWLLVCLASAPTVWFYMGARSGEDVRWAKEVCEYRDPTTGAEENRPAGYRPPGERGRCDGTIVPSLIRETDWNIGNDLALLIAKIGLVGFVLPMTNSLLLGARGYGKVVRVRWTQSATRRAVDERSRRLNAEALSAKAEAETERLARQLETMGVPQ